MSGRYRRMVGGLTWLCANERHDECSREDCVCYCHGGASVREPRLPVPKSSPGQEQARHDA